MHTMTDKWRLLPLLRILKIGLINSLDYRTILSNCHHLNSFEFLLFSEHNFSSSHVTSHRNLKRMNIKVLGTIWPGEEHTIQNYLLSAPNLERLTIFQSIYRPKMEEFLLNYDWYATTINVHLLLLQQFRFYVHITPTEERTGFDVNNILRQIKNNFKNIHDKRYQSQLIIKT